MTIRLLAIKARCCHIHAVEFALPIVQLPQPLRLKSGYSASSPA
jgi:hypothetical protein